jgi:hypothetical protein
MMMMMMMLLLLLLLKLFSCFANDLLEQLVSVQSKCTVGASHQLNRCIRELQYCTAKGCFSISLSKYIN